MVGDFRSVAAVSGWALPVLGMILLSAGCIDASKRLTAPGGGGQRTKACENGIRPSADGAFDDAEDGNTEVTKVGGRDGYWFTSVDPKGSSLEPTPFAVSDGGTGGSKHALRIHGETSSASGAWGVLLGATMVGGGAYDASVYAGVSFKAKVGPKSTRKVRFKVGDVNTHPDGGACKNCWNHFGKDLTLSTDWQVYEVAFRDMTQEPGWGDQVPAVTPGKLLSVNWSIGSGQPYDLWVDDIQFFECR
jgi:hypothetical protein